MRQQKKQGTLAVVLSVLRRADPIYLHLLVIYSLLGGAQVLCNVLLPRRLIDELTGAQRPDRLLLWAALIVGLNAVWFLAGKGLSLSLNLHRELATREVDRVFAQKVMNIEYRCLENPHCLDLRERARFAMQNQSAVDNLVSSLAQLVQQAAMLVSLTAVMLRLSFVLVALELLTVGLMLAVEALFARYQQKFFAELLPVNRRYGYYVNLAFDTRLQKEFRLYNAAPMLCGRITEYNRSICSWFTRYNHRQGLVLGATQVIMNLQTALAYGYVGLRCIDGMRKGTMSIGSLTMYVGAAIGFSGAILEFGNALITLRQMLGYLQPLAELMQLPDEGGRGGRPLGSEIRSIRFEHVGFAYPGSDKKVLDDVSFEIRGGEKISIVGLNGAGKTTIVKLLCRLYRPQQGRILLNDIEIGEYEYESYVRGVAAVFQDYKLLNLSIEENVTCLEPGADPAGALRRLEEVGLGEKIASLPQGIESRIGREYDKNGIELSGGQAQKVAIARALYRDAPFVILDEPTSALDPMSEAAVYENFRSLVGSRTAVFISHRMSSSVFCDRVLVLENGRVAAFDTHANLMRQGGLYSRLFTSQAANYRC